MINVIERLWVSASKGKREKLLLNRDYWGRLRRVGGAWWGKWHYSRAKVGKLHPKGQIHITSIPTAHKLIVVFYIKKNF